MESSARSRSPLARRLLLALEARPEVQDAYLFGSHASGRAQAHSDIDVAVWIDAEPPQTGYFGYAAELTTHLIAALGTNEVDVVVLNRAPLLLYHRVPRDGRRPLSRIRARLRRGKATRCRATATTCLSWRRSRPRAVPRQTGFRDQGPSRSVLGGRALSGPTVLLHKRRAD